ncbi:hypothetical protein DFH08DRAFT_915768 [Mycena albidolilacea]|uniref:Fumarylacetoacetase-like C-terminal domain-containing protein n=1 Tax=Mycena albidolilacea TaxID=1033008 RepID=A0AAD7ELX2_9AGAR|nr:hypothetical protein DFH08DRAFT_915768 [Mycena albidolilacea]
MSPIHTVRSRKPSFERILTVTHQWTRHIRFFAAETSQVHIGQPVDPSLDGIQDGVDCQAALEPLSREEVKYVRCLGLNYADNAVLLSFSVLFAKPVTHWPWCDGAKEHYPDYEVALVIVIGKPARDVSEANALDYVLGYAPVNDVSFRKHQMAVSQWMFSKFDYMNPLGPCLVSGTAIPDPQKIPLKCF